MQTRNISPEISRASSALVFDAPITFDQPPIDPARDDRGLSAFAGYESGSVSYYNTFTDNRAGNGRGDRFVKETYVEQSGAVER
jgi:hypothetical protein